MQNQTARAERGVLSHAEREWSKLIFGVFLAHAEREPKCHAERACLRPQCVECGTRAERGVHSTLSVGVRWGRICV